MPLPKLERRMKRENGKRVRASEFWSFRVMRNGKSKSYSTKETDHDKAKVIMSTILGNLARGRAGLPEEDGTEEKIVPTLATFIDEKFLPYLRGEKFQPKTKEDYEYRCAKFKAHAELASTSLDAVEEVIETYCADARRAKHKGKIRGYSERTIIGDLIVLKKILMYAFEKKVIAAQPRFSIPKHNPKDERHERREITPDEETAYLAACTPLLRDVATIMFDTGLRPDECYRLKPHNLRSGYVHNEYGKTKRAKRDIPASKRVQEIFTRRKGTEWLFPTFTRTGEARPIDRSSIAKDHAAAIKAAEIPGFIIYDIRRTALTRWGRKINIFDLQELAGHSDIETTRIYIMSSDQEKRKILPAEEQIHLVAKPA